MDALPSPTLKRVHDTNNAYYLAVKFVLINFHSKSLNKNFNFVVPSGLIVDGASIPRIFWRVIGHPLSSRYWVAFVVHDYLYGFSDISEDELDMTRKQVDLLFYDMLRAEGVGWWKGKTMLKAVRSAGWAAFRKSPNKFITEGRNDD